MIEPPNVPENARNATFAERYTLLQKGHVFFTQPMPHCHSSQTRWPQTYFTPNLFFSFQIFPMIVAPNWIQLDERRRHQMGLVPIKLVPLARISWLSTFQQIFIYKIWHSWWKCGTAELQLKSSFQIRIFFSVHCFRDFRRLGKSLSELWSNREEESEEVRCQYKGNSRIIQR